MYVNSKAEIKKEEENIENAPNKFEKGRHKDVEALNPKTRDMNTVKRV